MKYSSKQNRTRSTRMSHKSLIGVAVAATVLVIGVVTALSMQSGQTQKAKVEEGKPQVANQSRRNYVTSNAAGQTVVLDRQTGQTRPLTPEEARRLAEGIKQLVNQSSEGLVPGTPRGRISFDGPSGTLSERDAREKGRRRNDLPGVR